ncbi:MAG: YARHG domain-containing protein [Jaaginema sp. PMC 1079.18]|nr:YARHG domain-containing protein [Jaaginema sp. PMC 1079.18]
MAEDTYIPSQRLCVIKQLKPLIQDPKLSGLIRDRFQREAAILEDLGAHHQQIPNLYAYFCEGTEFYLVQEWIDGETLSQTVRNQGIFTENQVYHLLLKVLPVLVYIHNRGIIHRDIKPDNLIIRNSDRLPVLIDFGAVRETLATQINSQGEITSSIAIGTPGFMPSEQAAGRPIFSSDLYSLGLTAIYLLTQKTPQQLPTDAYTGEILWQDAVTGLSAEFRAVLTKMVQSHPRDRYPTAQTLLEALQPALTMLPTEEVRELTQPQPTNDASDVTRIMPSHRQLWQGERKWVLGGILGVAIAATTTGLFVLSSSNNSPLPQVLSSPVNSIAESPNLDLSYGWLSERRVTEKDLLGKDAVRLSLMRNSIFARKGRKFNNAELQQYFNEQSWYNPRYEPDEFPSDSLTSLEAQNAAFILEYQNQKGLRWLP